jgi:hypothetical protein
MVSQVIWHAVRSKPVSCLLFRLWLDWRITPMCKVKVAKCYDNRIRIQASLLIWLKVVKQARESLGFFVKLRDILRPQRGGTL